ncbi:hypothetical protein [Streptomyces sp. NPDC006638]|uniref:hypothetical protein n=1 Tax=unclassified Streptomyces TaxID=2593676 RepID=UPI0033BE8C5B
MAFGADELRVLRRALAVALRPAPLPDEDVRACLRLAESVDEAEGEADRMRAFLLADLARYRAALPGSVGGYLELLQDALAADYRPGPDDLAALRALRGNTLAAALLDRCQEPSVPRARLFSLPGGRAADEPKQPRQPRPEQPDRPKPSRDPRDPRKPGEPARPMPKPSEVFPPRRRPKPPPEERAAG